MILCCIEYIPTNHSHLLLLELLAACQVALLNLETNPLHMGWICHELVPRWRSVSYILDVARRAVRCAILQVRVANARSSLDIFQARRN